MIVQIGFPHQSKFPQLSLRHRTARILKKFDYTELPMVDELIADLYVLDDITRRDLFEYAKMLKKNHTSPERAADLKDIK